MYFVRAAMSNPSLSLPTTLPPGLYEQAGGKPSSVVSHGTGGSIGLPSSPLGSAFLAGQTSVKPQFTGGVLNAVRPQYTSQPLQPQTKGQRRLSASITSLTSPFPNVIKPQTASSQLWDVTPAEKATFDGFFRTLDTQNKGYIEGDVAVPFLLQSGLGEDVLAQVW
jgi:epidermal growth factor receptor substrate 15